MKVALNQLDGDLSRLIKALRQDILDVLAQVEVNIDYPESVSYTHLRIDRNLPLAPG